MMRRKRDSLKALFRKPIVSGDVYKYSPLVNDNSIRVLELLPARSSRDPLHGTLTEGKDEFPETLNLTGGYIKITTNLAEALRSLRLTEKSRIIWIDAVCINQSDHVEKGLQIAGMANVYKNASEVLAWLGEDSQDDVVDMKAIISLSREAKNMGLGNSLEGQKQIMMEYLRGGSENLGKVVDFLSTADRVKFFLLYGNAWFTRMWIVQEALLTSRLVLVRGSKSLSWEDFRRAMILLHAAMEAIHTRLEDTDVFHKHAWSLIVVRDYFTRSLQQKGSHCESDFMYYVNQLRRRDCKDDRDRLYALKSLLPASSRLVITPDYEKSTVQVFTNLALRQLQEGRMEILYQAGLCRNLAETFNGLPPYNFPPSEPVPSWVPVNTTYVGWTPYFGDNEAFLPDTTVSPMVSFPVDNPRRLVTHVAFIDSVILTLPLSFVHDETLRPDHPQIFLMMREVLKTIYEKFMQRHQSRTYPTGEDPSSAFASAIMGGGTSDEYKKDFTFGVNDETYTPLQVWQAYKTQCLSSFGKLHLEMLYELETKPTDPGRRLNGIRESWYKTSAHSGGAWALTHYLKRVLRYHVFFVTKKGYIGLVSHLSERKKQGMQLLLSTD